MKIAYFSDTFYPQVNGIVTSIINSSRILAEKGHKIFIFTIKTEGNIKLHRNIKLVRYASINAFNYPGYELAIPKMFDCLNNIRHFKPDVIHVHTPTLLGWMGLACGKLNKIPVVGTYHTIVPDFLKYFPLVDVSDSNTAKNIVWRYTNSFYKKCNIITTPSYTMKKELIKNGIDKKIKVISNGVDLKLFHPKKRKAKNFRILYVGRISYEKNIDVIFKAISLFAKKCDKFEFYVAGAGPELKKLKELASSLKISSHVRFLGAVNHKLLPELYSSSDIFVNASTIETEGIVILEAMACGLPIIGVNKRAVPEIVKDSTNGFIVKDGDFKSMSKKIIELYNKTKLRNKMGQESMKIAQKYDISICVRKMEQIYKTVA